MVNQSQIARTNVALRDCMSSLCRRGNVWPLSLESIRDLCDSILAAFSRPIDGSYSIQSRIILFQFPQGKTDASVAIGKPSRNLSKSCVRIDLLQRWFFRLTFSQCIELSLDTLDQEPMRRQGDILIEIVNGDWNVTTSTAQFNIGVPW